MRALGLTFPARCAIQTLRPGKAMRAAENFLRGPEFSEAPPRSKSTTPEISEQRHDSVLLFLVHARVVEKSD